MFLVADYAAGISVKEIRKKYDCADSQIYRSMRVMETNIPRRSTTVQITDPEKSVVLELYGQGKSTIKIGRMMNGHHSAIRRVIVEATGKNLSERKFVRLTEDEKTKLKGIFAEGTTCAENSKMTGHSKTTVRRIANDSPMKHHRTFSEADRQNLREAFKEGLSLRKTAQKFNSGTSSVKFWFDKFKRGL